MVTEEIDLTHTLEKQGVRVYETDLGELIVQLRNEPPYHLMTPAMHLTRKQIAELFAEKYGGVESDDPEHLVGVARRELRKAFFAAEMGVSGANFLVADTGMVALTTNEGNGRLGSSLPRIHVAVTGIEKVIPRMEDLAVIWPTLARAAVGIPIACYNTLLGGPRNANEPDGPEEFHVVLLDNGRSELLADAEQREVLHCVRCGACLNVCPVFRKVGGHSYGTVYGGPIGSVLMPHLGWAGKISAFIVRVVAVRGVHECVPGENRSAPSLAAEPAERGEGNAAIFWRARSVWAVAMGDDERESIRVLGRRRAGAAARGVWAGAGADEARSAASMDANARGAADSGEIFSRDVEGAAWRKLTSRPKGARGSWRGSAARCAFQRRSTRCPWVRRAAERFSRRLPIRWNGFGRSAR